MECAPVRSQAWLDEHEADLIQLPADDAVALVEGAGLVARAIAQSGEGLPQELRQDRVTLWLTPTGTVGAADAG